MRKGDSPLISSMSAMSLNIAAMARFCISHDLNLLWRYRCERGAPLESWRVEKLDGRRAQSFQLFNSTTLQLSVRSESPHHHTGGCCHVRHGPSTESYVI